jgi:flavin reductase (DIM6/NTAB) family NADH-FMN oxidoreductase RutF
MAKEIWKPGNMLYPLPAVLVTVADKKGNENVITIAWTGTINSDPAMVFISVRPSRYSYHMLEETGEFVINLTTKELARATDYCGVRTGKLEDKFQAMHLTKAPAKYVKAPLIEESPVNIECKVVKTEVLGSHTMFMAEVLAVHADAKYMDKTNKFSLEKADPIVYSHGNYYALGNKIGKFGYSVEKRKSKRK